MVPTQQNFRLTDFTVTKTDFGLEIEAKAGMLNITVECVTYFKLLLFTIKNCLLKTHIKMMLVISVGTAGQVGIFQ